MQSPVSPRQTQRIQTLGIEVAGSVLCAAERLVVDNVAASGLAAPGVVVVAVIGEGDLRRGGRAPARLDHDVGFELAVLDGALLLGLVSNGGENLHRSRRRNK